MAMFIAEYREAHGLDLDVFARAVRRMGARKRPARPINVSDRLVFMLEIMPGAVTHPNIADLLAEACGATAAERDSIVDERYRGDWTPPRKPLRLEDFMWEWPFMPPRPEPEPEPEPELMLDLRRREKKHQAHNARAVVAVNRMGEAIARFESVKDAADAANGSEDCVHERCKRHVRMEFKYRGYTWRYLKEWEAMTEEERRRDVGRVRE